MTDIKKLLLSRERINKLELFRLNKGQLKDMVRVFKENTSIHVSLVDDMMCDGVHFNKGDSDSILVNGKNGILDWIFLGRQ